MFASHGGLGHSILVDVRHCVGIVAKSVWKDYAHTFEETTPEAAILH